QLWRRFWRRCAAGRRGERHGNRCGQKALAHCGPARIWRASVGLALHRAVSDSLPWARRIVSGGAFQATAHERLAIIALESLAGGIRIAALHLLLLAVGSRGGATARQAALHERFASITAEALCLGIGIAAGHPGLLTVLR